MHKQKRVVVVVVILNAKQNNNRSVVVEQNPLAPPKMEMMERGTVMARKQSRPF
jgi:hypothetical protein